MFFRGVLSQAKQLTVTLADFCYPRVCPICNQLSSAGTWCEACDKQLSDLQFAPACDVCAMPLSQHLAPCPYCEGKGLRPFERIARLGIYTPPLRDLVLRVKYVNDWPLAERLAERLGEQDSVRAILQDADAIVPVPLHWRRHTIRGFNQAEVVSRVLSKRSGKRCVPAVARLRDTPTQTAMHKRAARLENLKNAFGVTHPKSIRDRHVVLVDDVMTTGATLQTLAREIRRHKPRAMSVIVVAIADPKGRAFELI
jgi:competence protein ComFC